MKLKDQKRQWFEEGAQTKLVLKDPDAIREICRIRKETLIKELETKIMRVMSEGKSLLLDEKVLAASLSNSPTATACAINVIHGLIWMALFAMLFCGTWAIWTWSLGPFGLDRANLLVLSLTVVSIALFDIIIRKIKKLFPEKQFDVFLLFIAIAAAIFILIADADFGIVRGRLAQLGVGSSTSSPVEDLSTANNNAGSNVSGVKDFYRKGFKMLNVIMPLIAITICIGTAITFYEGFEKLSTAGPILYSHHKLASTRRTIINKGTELNELKNMPDIFEAEFLRGAMMPQDATSITNNSEQAVQIRNSEEKKLWTAIVVFTATLVVLLVLVSMAFSADSTVVLIDLTASTHKKDYKNIEEFQKNVKGVEGIIAGLKAGSKFTVIGITEDSFARPYVLMDMKVGNDPGYFQERLQEAKKILLTEWRKATKDIRPDAPASDIFGALSYASQIFQNDTKMSKTLFILSDMRQATISIDLETPQIIDMSILERTEKAGLISELQTVKVYVLGAQTVGKSQPYWQSLKSYWSLYFKKAGADLKTFTMERRINHE